MNVWGISDLHLSFARPDRRWTGLRCGFRGGNDGRGDAHDARRFQKVAAAEIDAVRGLGVGCHAGTLIREGSSAASERRPRNRYCFAR